MDELKDKAWRSDAVAAALCYRKKE